MSGSPWRLYPLTAKPCPPFTPLHPLPPFSPSASVSRSLSIPTTTTHCTLPNNATLVADVSAKQNNNNNNETYKPETTQQRLESVTNTDALGPMCVCEVFCSHYLCLGFHPFHFLLVLLFYLSLRIYLSHIYERSI
eukprot:gene9608-6756_t